MSGWSDIQLDATDFDPNAKSTVAAIDKDEPLERPAPRRAAPTTIVAPVGAASERAAALAAGPAPTTLAPTGTVSTPDGKKAVFMTEAQYLAAVTPRESHLLHTLVLTVGGALLLFANAVIGMNQGGAVGAIGLAFFSLIGFGVSCAACFGCAKAVGWMFHEDFGGFGEMLLRVSAMCVAYELAMFLVGLAVGPLFAALFGFPILAIAAVVLLGMEGIAAFVYAGIVSAVKFLLVMIVIGALFNMAMSAAGF